MLQWNIGFTVENKMLKLIPIANEIVYCKFIPNTHQCILDIFSMHAYSILKHISKPSVGSGLNGRSCTKRCLYIKYADIIIAYLFDIHLLKVLLISLPTFFYVVELMHH